jgi:hypothetical protein
LAEKKEQRRDAQLTKAAPQDILDHILDGQNADGTQISDQEAFCEAELIL